jgi:hypothetical protein
MSEAAVKKYVVRLSAAPDTDTIAGCFAAGNGEIQGPHILESFVVPIDFDIRGRIVMSIAATAG